MAVNGFEEITYDLTPDEIKMATNIGNRIKNAFVGKENAITAGYIVQKYKEIGYKRFTDARFRKMISYLRRKGYAICSSSKGYFYAANLEEIRRHCESVDQRINEMKAGNDAMKQHILLDRFAVINEAKELIETKFKEHGK